MADSWLMLTVAFVLMLLVGLSLGLLGSGGSIITLPVLVYVAGIPVASAVGMSLVIVGATAASGAAVQGRRFGFDAKAAVVFALTGAAGSFAGAHLTHLVPPALLMLAFGGLMVLAGARMTYPRVPVALAADTCRIGRCTAAGLSVGVLTGFLGVGGGFLILPALVLFAGADMRRAVPTSLSVIAANCAGGLVGQSRQIAIPLFITACFLVAALAGMFAGTRWSGRLTSQSLQRAFAWAILSLGAAIVVRNLWLLLR